MTPETILGTLAAAALAVVAEYARRLRKRLSLVGKGIDDERQQRRISDAGRAGAQVSEQHLAHELRKERADRAKHTRALRSEVVGLHHYVEQKMVLGGEGRERIRRLYEMTEARER